MELAQIFEVMMLICFGAAWPFSIYKSYTSRRNEGKSIYFLLVIFVGYLCGMIFQYLLVHGFNYVFFVFVLNAGMVAIDIALYYRNKWFQENT